MKLQPFSKSLIAVVLLAGLGELRAAAQSDQTTTTATNRNESAKPAAVVDKTAPSSGVAEILKMLDAGVSKEVIKVYLENSTATYNLSSADIIALKERGVTDEITLVLLKRGSENKGQASTAVAASKTPEPAPVQTVRIVNSGRLDPEGYDYFQHYYLQARTLAYTYQTLGYQPGPYGYGYYPSVGYGPYFRGGYGYRPRY
jgi:hypothetical protein